MRLPFQSPLVIQLRRSKFPENRDFAFRVGMEFVRAEVDGRQPAAWASAALQPRWRPRPHYEMSEPQQ